MPRTGQAANQRKTTRRIIRTFATIRISKEIGGWTGEWPGGADEVALRLRLPAQPALGGTGFQPVKSGILPDFVRASSE